MILPMRIATLGALLLLAALALPASAASWTFQAGGFSGGGALNGSFSGIDLDNNGMLDHFGPGGELASFSLAFSGDSQVGGFSLGLSDVTGFAFRLDGGSVLGDYSGTPHGEGLEAASGDFYVAAGAGLGVNGVLVLNQIAGDSTTPGAITVSAVPEPDAGWMFGAGLITVAAARRLRNRRDPVMAAG